MEESDHGTYIWYDKYTPLDTYREKYTKNVLALNSEKVR